MRTKILMGFALYSDGFFIRVGHYVLLLRPEYDKPLPSEASDRHLVVLNITKKWRLAFSKVAA